MGKRTIWLVNLPANNIRTWEELVAAFCTKFFIVEPKVELGDLSNAPQKKNKVLSNYVLRFKERAFDCKEVASESSLTGLCIKGMQTKYRVHIENHAIPNFSELMIFS